MAVQQNKKSASKRGMHRAHDFLPKPALAVEPVSGEVHLRHHVSPSGLLSRQEGRQDQGGRVSAVPRSGVSCANRCRTGPWRRSTRRGSAFAFESGIAR